MACVFHPHPDSQTEQLQDGMKQYLQEFVNDLQHDWVQWLALAEFAANDEISESMKSTPSLQFREWTRRCHLQENHPRNRINNGWMQNKFKV